MRRSERLFAMAEYLRARRTGTTAAAIAERFDVTMRTVYRDLATLRAASLPINAERGRGGGLALDRAYTLPPVNFSPREAAVLIRGGQWLIDMRILPFTTTVHQAIDKLRAALSAAGQRELLAQLKTLKFIGVPGRAIPENIRRSLEQAWFERQPLRIVYVTPNLVESERTVQINELLIDRSHIMLNCTDLEINEPRQFRLDRILAAKVMRDLHTKKP